jgi:DNA-binding response OmpR family regulator
MQRKTAMTNVRKEPGPVADKLIVFDDDPYFGALISATARQFNFSAHYFQSLYAMGSFARIRNYDIAIIDVFMDSIRGDELATYIDMFCADIPVILVSGERFDHQDKRIVWPPSVRAFIPKSAGAHQILAAAKATLNRDRMLRRLAAGEPCINHLDITDLGQLAPAGIV